MDDPNDSRHKSDKAWLKEQERLKKEQNPLHKSQLIHFTGPDGGIHAVPSKSWQDWMRIPTVDYGGTHQIPTESMSGAADQHVRRKYLAELAGENAALREKLAKAQDPMAAWQDEKTKLENDLLAIARENDDLRKENSKLDGEAAAASSSAQANAKRATDAEGSGEAEGKRYETERFETARRLASLQEEVWEKDKIIAELKAAASGSDINKGLKEELAAKDLQMSEMVATSEKQINDLTKANRALNTENDTLLAERDELVKYKEENEKRLLEGASADEALKAELGKLKEECAAKDANIAELSEGASSADEALKSELAALKEEGGAKEKRVEELAAANAALTAEKEALAADKASLEGEREVLSSEKSALAEERDGLASENAGMKEELEHCKEVKEELARTKEELERLKLFQQVDKDHDGRISREEMAAHRKAEEEAAAAKAAEEEAAARAAEEEEAEAARAAEEAAARLKAEEEEAAAAAAAASTEPSAGASSGETLSEEEMARIAAAGKAKREAAKKGSEMKVRHTLTPGDIEKGANIHTKGTRGVYEAPKTSLRDSASVKEATAATKLQAMQRGNSARKLQR